MRRWGPVLAVFMSLALAPTAFGQAKTPITTTPAGIGAISIRYESPGTTTFGVAQGVTKHEVSWIAPEGNTAATITITASTDGITFSAPSGCASSCSSSSFGSAITFNGVFTSIKIQIAGNTQPIAVTWWGNASIASGGGGLGNCSTDTAVLFDSLGVVSCSANFTWASNTLTVSGAVSVSGTASVADLVASNSISTPGTIYLGGTQSYPGISHVGSYLVLIGTGSADFAVSNGQVGLRLGTSLGWTGGSSAAAALDTYLLRESAGVMSLNGDLASNYQPNFWEYRTHASGTNYEAFSLGYANSAGSNVIGLYSHKGSGGGSYRDVYIGNDAVDTWVFGTSASANVPLYPAGDNTQDFGKTTNRVRNGYFGTGLDVGGSSIPAGYTFYVSAGTSGLNGRVYAPNLTASAGLQTAVVCVSATGELIADSVACLASTERVKHNINTYSGDAVALIGKIRPITYVKNNDGWESRPDLQDWTEHFGMSAEQVASVEPRLAAYDADGKPRTVQYQDYTAVLTSAIQQLNARLKALEER